ncbi:MAG TPA: DUF5011 domain-containing protein, partial [Candidatus Paceibacterota bacterium]|nr:DUF5011 domain-containing protein [Candidatus Paceibacterota bacterium]
NTASATYSSAFGYQNTASGFGSTAFGIGNTASATYSSAFGYQNTASANSASAFGSGITNSIANSTMVGPSNTAKLTILSTGNVEAPFFTATSTTASTFNGGITINGGGLTIPVLAGNLSVGGTSGLTFNNSTHRLGIGTTSPAYPIEVAGSGSIGGAAGLVQTYVYNGAPHSIGTYVGAVPGSGYPIGGWLNTITNDPLYFGTNYTGIPQATLTTTGRFGIGTTSPETTFSVVGAACISKGAGATAACSNTPGTVTADLYTTSLADLAERYQTYDPTLSAGDVIALDPAHTLAVEKATSAAASFIGVVSSAPGVVLGGVNASSASTTVPVALAGRVPVKFSTQNGAIAIGDRLTVSSTTPGIAVKLVGSGSYFGQALEPSSAAQGNTLMAFINPGTYYAGLSIDGAQTNTASASTAVNTSTNGFGLLLAAHATIGTATAPSGITLYDTVTKKPYCFSIANGAPVTTPGTCQTTSPQTTSPQPSPSAATPLAITVNGSNPTYVPVGATYTDAGATVTGGADNGHDPYRIYVSGSTTATSSPYINTRIPATYTLTYTVTDSANVTKSAHRQIVVGNANGMATSTTPAPTPSYSATSTSSPSTATSTPSHTATTTQATSTPPAVDTVPPVVSLNGAATMTLHVGDTFTDPGATAKDAVDGNLTAKIVETGKVDTSTAATYTLTYSATDAAGNTGTATRTVVVAPAPSPSAPTATTTPATASTTPSS